MRLCLIRQIPAIYQALVSWVMIRLSELCGAGKTGEAIKAAEQQAMRKESVKMETLDIADEAAALVGTS